MSDDGPQHLRGPLGNGHGTGELSGKVFKEKDPVGLTLVEAHYTTHRLTLRFSS